MDDAARPSSISNSRVVDRVHDLTIDESQAPAPAKDITLTVAGPRYNNTLLNVDYASELLPAIQERNVDLIARCLYSAYREGDLVFIKNIPQQTYSEILRIMHPNWSVSKLLFAHADFSEHVARQMRVVPSEGVARDYAKLLSDMYAIRRNAGVELALEDYKILLHSASVLGQSSFGLLFWKRLYDAGHLPDVDCYNYYMGCVVWAGRHRTSSRQTVRVVPFHQKARQKEVLGNAYRNYRIGSGGLHENATAIFNRMMSRGAIANEESFCILAAAAAREGNLDTVKAVLKRVWNLNVDALTSGDEPGTDTLRHIDKDESLHPTTELLYTVAHAWGINNDISTALRLVDYIARSYDLPISTEVWSQLFEWTYVLAATRYGTTHASDGSKTGELPSQSLTSLWQTMTSAPYKAQPSLAMYNHYISNLRERRHMPFLLQALAEAKKLDDQHYAVLKEKHRELDNAMQEAAEFEEAHRDRSAVLAKSQQLRADCEYLALLRGRNSIWLRRWLRFLIGPTRYWARGKGIRAADASDGINEMASLQSHDYSYRILPHMLWTWRHFAPTEISYQIPGGQIEFRVRSEEDINRAASRRQNRQQDRERVRGSIPRVLGDNWFGDGAMTYRMMRLALAGKFERTSPQVPSDAG